MNFNLERLIKLREERKNKVLTQYEKVFGFCLNKITLANNLNKWIIGSPFIQFSPY